MPSPWLNKSDGIIRIFVVRHGQTPWNIEKRLQGHVNIPLNEQGKKQAAQLGDRLKDYDFDYVITSDLQRCLQTLDEVLGDRLDIPPMKKTPNFRERYMGDVEGMLIADARAKYGAGFKDRGETKQQLLARLDEEWLKLLEHCKDNGYKNVLMCAHGGVITNFFQHLYSAKKYKLANDIKPQDLEAPYNTSLSICDVDSSDFTDGTIQMWGSTTHLGRQMKAGDKQLV